jgi:predicted DNA-binding protein
MEMIALTPERKAQLDSYAQRHGKDSAEALDEVLADWLEDETRDYQEAVEGIRRGFSDLKSGRVQPADIVFERLRAKHAIPR